MSAWVFTLSVVVSQLITFLNLQALKLQPQNAKALFRRGQSYFYMKDFEKAERDLRAAEKLEPKGLLSLTRLKFSLGIIKPSLFANHHQGHFAGEMSAIWSPKNGTDNVDHKRIFHKF